MIIELNFKEKRPLFLGEFLPMYYFLFFSFYFKYFSR